MSDKIISVLIDKLQKRLLSIENNQKYLSFLIDKRYANEKMVQLEVMNIISQMEQVYDYIPERHYDSNLTDKCDFWFKTKKMNTGLRLKLDPRITIRNIGMERQLHMVLIP